jgi:hypothetical protein
MSIENKAPIQTNLDMILDKGPFYHGTKANLEIGCLIKIGFSSNYGKGNKANFVYMTATLDAAIWGAELALGDGDERIYIVERFPGNPTRSYRTCFPLKVIGEISEWKGHSPEVLKNMKDNLNKLKEQGIEAINE